MIGTQIFPSQDQVSAQSVDDSFTTEHLLVWVLVFETRLSIFQTRLAVGGGTGTCGGSELRVHQQNQASGPGEAAESPQRFLPGSSQPE